MTPAMPVPEPRQSALPRPLPAVMSTPRATRPASCGTLPSTPESTTATSTPLPLVVFQAPSAAARR
jgi:hypothetical protein